jgi:hypothetical protein
MQKIHAIIKSANNDEKILGFDINPDISWHYNIIDVNENLKANLTLYFIVNRFKL